MKNTRFLLMPFLALSFALVVSSCGEDDPAPVLPKAIFEFTVADDNSGNVEFKNLSIDGETYVWNFGDGSANSTEKDPTHLYEASGKYAVTLTATNKDGSDDGSQEVTVTQNIVAGGNMSDESAWTFKQVWTNADNAVSHGFSNGEFKFDNADGTLYSQAYLWQEVDIEAGKTYKFKSNVKSAGTSSIWFEVYFGKVDPNEDGDYGDGGKRVYLSSFNDPNSGCANNAFDGDINAVSQAGCASPNEKNANLIGSDGSFTLTAEELTERGTIYLVFKTGSWDSADNYKDGLFLDNVSIIEVL